MSATDPKQTSAMGPTKGACKIPQWMQLLRVVRLAVSTPSLRLPVPALSSRLAEATWFMARTRMGPAIYHVKMPVVRANS